MQKKTNFRYFLFWCYQHYYNYYLRCFTGNYNNSELVTVCHLTQLHDQDRYRHNCHCQSVCILSLAITVIANANNEVLKKRRPIRTKDSAKSLCMRSLRWITHCIFISLPILLTEGDGDCVAIKVMREMSDTMTVMTVDEPLRREAS